MTLFNSPDWTRQFDFPYATARAIPDAVFADINARLDRLQRAEPVVSIVIPAWNEEVNVLRSVASLARTRTDLPLEIIVVNNNSTDQTQYTLDRLHVRSVFQPVPGWGPARQRGLEAARGEYVLTGDADSLYPAGWVDELVGTLKQPGVVCVYGRYSFLPKPGFPRWQLYAYERMKDAVAELRHLKRPHLNAYGMSFGYRREPALKVGYVPHKIRGEDGRLCFDLMAFGTVRQVRSERARVWTGTRTLEKEGSLGGALLNRVRKELGRVTSLFSAQPPHDTKTSAND